MSDHFTILRSKGLNIRYYSLIFFGKFTKQLSLSWLAVRIVNFQNSFVRRIFNKQSMLIQQSRGFHMTSRHHIKAVLRHVSTAITVITYNSPLCLGSSNLKSIFDFVITVVAVTPYPFICSIVAGRQFAILFGFCVYNFLVEVISSIDFILL